MMENNPRVNIKLENGQLTVDTNVKDKILINGMLETAKLVIAIPQNESNIIQPKTRIEGL